MLDPVADPFAIHNDSSHWRELKLSKTSAPLLLRAALRLPFQRQQPDALYTSRCELALPSDVHATAYRQLLGFDHSVYPQPKHRLSLCQFYPLLQKAQLASMLAWPNFKVVGLIHLDNSLQWLSTEPKLLSPVEPVQISTALQSMTTQGHQYLIATQQLSLDAKLLLRAQSRYLVHQGPTRLEKPVLPDLTKAVKRTQWTVPSDLAKRYAWLSGDLNPIHLWQWSARLFGMRQAILHGMAAAALLEARLAQAQDHLQVQFIKPILPGQPLALYQHDATQFSLVQHERICLLAQTASSH